MFCLFLKTCISARLGSKQEDGKYKHTVDLPKTAFSLRANSVIRELELQKLWDENQVFKRVSERNNGVSCKECFEVSMYPDGYFADDLCMFIGNFCSS